MALDGRRRRLALAILLEAGDIDEDYPVRTYVETDPARQAAAVLLTNTAVPVHVADVAAGIVKMVNHPPPHATVVNMTGSQICTLAGYLSILHQTLHRKPPLRVLPIPLALIKPLLPLTNILSNGILSPGSIALLEAGNCADNADFAALLARAPLAAEQCVAADEMGDARMRCNQGCLKDVQAAFACQMHLKLAYNFCILLFGQTS